MKSKLLIIAVLLTTSIVAQKPKFTLKIDYTESVKNRTDSASLNLKYNSYKAFTERKSTLYIIDDSSFYTYNEYKTKKKLFSKIIDSNSVDAEISMQQNILNAELNKMKAIKDLNCIYAKKITDNIVAINDFTYDNIIYRKYFILDTVENIKWNLIDDTKKIDSFKCQKAIGKFRGRLWEAWFTDQIPISSGPWKLFGLPGLILEAKDTSGLYSFTCNAIQLPVSKLNKEDLLINISIPKTSVHAWGNILSIRDKEYKEGISKLISLFEKGKPSDSGPQVEKTMERFRMLKVDIGFPYSPIELNEE